MSCCPEPAGLSGRWVACRSTGAARRRGRRPFSWPASPRRPPQGQGRNRSRPDRRCRQLHSPFPHCPVRMRRAVRRRPGPGRTGRTRAGDGLFALDMDVTDLPTASGYPARWRKTRPAIGNPADSAPLIEPRLHAVGGSDRPPPPRAGHEVTQLARAGTAGRRRRRRSATARYRARRPVAAPAPRPPWPPGSR